MVEELTLKHLSGYLPYGLKAEMLDYKSDYVGRQYDVIIGVHQWSKNGDWCLLTDGGSKPSFNHIKPILRPLSDLTKEIEVDGEKFVPIEKMEQMGWFNRDCLNAYTILNIPYAMVQILLSWYFDIHNLIEQGLAIDYNTLND
jgi:hypothetical protein